MILIAFAVLAVIALACGIGLVVVVHRHYTGPVGWRTVAPPGTHEAMHAEQDARDDDKHKGDDGGWPHQGGTSG